MSPQPSHQDLEMLRLIHNRGYYAGHIGPAMALAARVHRYIPAVESRDIMNNLATTGFLHKEVTERIPVWTLTDQGKRAIVGFPAL